MMRRRYGVGAWDWPSDARQVASNRVEIVFAGSDTIKTSLGHNAAIRIEGTATRLTRALSPHHTRAPRKFTLWMSDDAYRLPLRVEARTEYGPVEVELVAYERGESPAVASHSER